MRYTLRRGSYPVTLSLKALVNYRTHHGSTHADGGMMQIDELAAPRVGVSVRAFAQATPFYLIADAGTCTALNSAPLRGMPTNRFWEMPWRETTPCLPVRTMWKRRGGLLIQS
jgi:hypothetical protein